MLFAHVAFSFIGLALGFFAVRGLFKPTPAAWTELFLAFAVLTTLTGFFLPFSTVTPAVGTGIVATLIFVAMFFARFVFHLAGKWQLVYAAGMVANAYLLVFVAIAQGFQKIGFFHALAPTLSEPPFAISQLAALLFFGWVGFRALKQPAL